jgi:hypothetical protein
MLDLLILLLNLLLGSENETLELQIGPEIIHGG